MNEWISIRKAYPEEAGEYQVKDCTHGASGTAYYNGYDWDRVEMKKGSLLLCEDIVTHWKPKELSLPYKNVYDKPEIHLSEQSSQDNNSVSTVSVLNAYFG
jgi:hypothetical protein